MKKSMLSFTAVMVLSVSSIAASAQSSAASQVMSGSNPRPQVMSGSNPRPQSFLDTLFSVFSILVMYTF